MSSIIDQDLIDAANATYQEKFQAVFEHEDVSPGLVDRICEVVPTESETNKVDLFGAMPIVRKWVGPKQEQVQRAYQQSVDLEKYEATFSLPRTKVRYDKLGLVGRRISAFMNKNRYWKEKILFDLLVTNPTGYDAVSMFSASHPHGPSAANQSNTTASAMSVSTLDAAIQAMTSLRDENGENLGLVPDLLVVGPKLRKNATEFTGSERLQSITAAGLTDQTSAAVAAGTIPNLYLGGMLEVLVWPRLVGTYDDYWYLFCTTSEAKSMLLFEGRDVEPVVQTQLEGEHRFTTDNLRWSLESDHAPAAGAWQTVYGGLVS